MQRRDREVISDRVTIYRRGKKGYYTADFHYDGQHRRRSLKTTNKKKAREMAILLAAEIMQGRVALQTPAPRMPAARTTLDDARQRFIASKQTDGRRRKTIVKYDGQLRNFQAFAASRGVTKLEQVTLPLIDDYRAQRRSTEVRGRKLSEVQQHHDALLLKQFFKWCVDRKLMAESPLAEQRFARPTPKRKAIVLTLAQVDMILRVAPKRLFAPLAVLAFTGMRSGNCRNLRVEDVDLAGGWIHVRSREGAETKAGNDWKVPIPQRLTRILEGFRWPRSGYLFTAPASRRYPEGGHWVNMKHFNDDFVRMVKKLGLPAGCDGGFTVHSLRHFYKSFCISHGVPREYVDAWQGHASIRSASDLYVHTFDEESQRLIQGVPFGDGMPAAHAG